MSRKRRIPLSPGFHAQTGETKGHLHEVYTTLGKLYGYQRIHVGSLMKEAVEAWARTARAAAPRERTAPSVLHAYVPHEKYPHCAVCGYARSERLMHTDACPPATQAGR